MEKTEYKSEAHLQSLCTLWYKNEYCNRDEARKKRLILIFNNPPNARMAGILKSLGLERGPSDQLYFPVAIKVMVWVEYKLRGMTQSDAQQEFEKLVRDFGCDYVLIHDETEFQNMIKYYEHGRTEREY